MTILNLFVAFFVLLTSPTSLYANCNYTLLPAATIVKSEPPQLSKLYDTEDKYILTVTYGKLTEQQFKALHEYFGAKSQVVYNPNRTYDIIDFLSPLQQALINKTFEYTSLVPSWGGEAQLSDGAKWSLKLGAEVFANCWGTACEVTRLNNPKNADSNYYVYWPSRWTADETLKDDKNANLVEEKNIQSGDMLIISDKLAALGNTNMIQHAAIYLTPELIFEKTNGSKDDPIRISYAKDVIGKYKKLFGENYSQQIRRFNEPGKNVLQPPTPADENDEIIKEIRTLPGMKQHPGPVMYMGEIGMGGGNDIGINGILIFQVKIDPQTGRGVLVGQPQDLAKFKDLK